MIKHHRKQKLSEKQQIFAGTLLTKIVDMGRRYVNMSLAMQRVAGLNLKLSTDSVITA